MPKRSIIEIYAGILEAVSEGISKPTNIMYRTKLSWLPLQRHLDVLLQKGFLTERQVNKRRVYEIAENGQRFLYYFQMARNELVIADTDIDEDATLKEAKKSGVPRSKNRG